MSDGRGDAVGAAVVQQATPPRREAAPGQQHGELGVAVAGDLGGQLERGARQASVGAVDDVERQARQPEPAPVVLEGGGLEGVDGEVHGPEMVGRQRARVLDGPGRGQVHPVDEHHHDVATQHRGLARLGRPGLELLVLLDVLAVQTHAAPGPRAA